MKVMQLILIASRYFCRYFRRYIFLFIALSFSFGIITAITAIQAGMEENVNKSAKSHYAGDMALVGRTKLKVEFLIYDVNKIRQVIDQSGINSRLVVTRTQFGDEGTIYFNGGAVRHKYTLGVDWDEEAENFQELSYSQGSFGKWDKKSGIVLSSPVAEELNVNIGDSVILEVRTRRGQANTGHFVVQAVIDDASIFGYYKCFLDRSALNALIGLTENEASTFGIYLNEGTRLSQEAEKLQQALEAKNLNIAPLVSNRDELTKEYKKTWKKSRLFLITLPVYLSEVSELLSAINIIAYFLYFLMLLIIIVSVAVTFRLILHEREKEIGTLRGIGFHEGDIVFFLIIETLILFSCSIVTGFLFGYFICWITGFFRITAIPSIEIFMKNGTFDAVFLWQTLLINSSIVLFVLIPTVVVPVHNISRKPLSLVLTGGKD